MDERIPIEWTEAGVKALNRTGRREQYSDPDTGMILLMTPAGAKTFYLVYRHGGGRKGPRRWYKVGVFGKDYGLAGARKQHKIKAGEVAAGKDPQMERKTARQTARDARKDHTVNELLNRYVKDYLDAGKVAKSTAMGYSQHIKAYIRPAWGTRLARSITSGDAATLLQGLSKGVRSKVKATGARIFSRGDLWGWIDKGENPFTGQDKGTTSDRLVRMDSDQIRQVGEYLRASDEPWQMKACVISLLCSGMRVSELSGEPRKDIPSPEWERDFKPDDGVLWLQHHKTVKKIGPKPIYFCPQLVTYFKALPRENEMILGGWHNGTKGWTRIRDGAGIKGITLHDVRHTFASIGDDLGFSEATVGALLGHAKSSQTGRYTHKLSKDLAVAAAAIGGHIWGLLGF